MAGHVSFERLLARHADGAELRRLVRYAELLEQWSSTHNLVRWSGREQLVERHIADALAACAVLGDRGVLLDVGSGAGLPGVPLLVVHSGCRRRRSDRGTRTTAAPTVRSTW
jgi:16S rRNA G527 N7-methylase RsmG